MPAGQGQNGRHVTRAGVTCGKQGQEQPGSYTSELTLDGGGALG